MPTISVSVVGAGDRIEIWSETGSLRYIVTPVSEAPDIETPATESPAAGKRYLDGQECPAPAELMAFARGPIDFASELSLRIGQHLRKCSWCLHQLESVNRDQAALPVSPSKVSAEAPQRAERRNEKTAAAVPDEKPSRKDRPPSPPAIDIRRRSPLRRCWPWIQSAAVVAACLLLAAMLVQLWPTKEPNRGDPWISAGSLPLGPALTPSPVVHGESFAVVIGVSNAPDRPKLFAAEDAARFADEVLLRQLNVFPHRIKLLVDEPPDHHRLESAPPETSEVWAAVDWLRSSVDPGDLVVVFIACHGELHGNGEHEQLRLVMGDGQTIAADELLNAFADLPSVMNLVILDSCYSGRGQPEKAHLMSPEDIDAPSPLLILSSTSADELSWAHSSDGSGLFQQALRQAFADADKADLDGDSFLTPFELSAHVQKHLRSLGAGAPSSQSPTLWFSDDYSSETTLFAIGSVSDKDRDEHFRTYPPLGPITADTPVPSPFRPQARRKMSEPTDEVGSRYYIYQEGETGRFLPNGFFPTGQGISVNPMSSVNPHSGALCVRLDCQLTEQLHAGSYFLRDGTWQPHDALNLFDKLEAHLGDSIKCRFWARSDDFASVQFKVGGIAQGDITDSLRFPVYSHYLRLTPDWTMYELDLTGKDMSSIVGAFAWHCDRPHNENRNVAFYLDDIYFVKTQPSPVDQ